MGYEEVFIMNQKQESIRTERTQISHGRLIHVISVFPAAARSTPEEKLKTLIDMELRGGKLCA